MKSSCKKVSFNIIAPKTPKKINLKGSFVTKAYTHNYFSKTFYNIVQENPEQVLLDLSRLDYIDANLSAFLLAGSYYLNREYSIKLLFDSKSIPDKLNVLARNGLLGKMNYGLNTPCPTDERHSTIHVNAFKFDEVDNFIGYIRKDFLGHRSLKTLSSNKKEKISSNYCELFDNAGVHGTEEHPIFTCGQYFPKKEEIKFSMVDLGNGFLRNVSDYTNGKIKTSFEAIKWAFKSKNSTKKDAPGGLGLPNLYELCVNQRGAIQITSGDCYLEINPFPINGVNKLTACKTNHFLPGTVINLTLSCK